MADGIFSGTKKFSAETCGVEGEDRTQLIRVIAIVFGGLGLFTFILRCAARFMGPHNWGKDDSVMCAVMVCRRWLISRRSPFSNICTS